jgi:hypothetical protein
LEGRSVEAEEGRMTIMDAIICNIKNFLSNKPVAAAPSAPSFMDLSGLLQPSANAAKVEVNLPVVVAPAPIEPVATAPVAAAPPVAIVIPKVIDWDQEARTDIPPHSTEEIVELLKHESPAQTQARIRVDGQRFWNSQGGRRVVR